MQLQQLSGCSHAVLAPVRPLQSRAPVRPSRLRRCPCRVSSPPHEGLSYKQAGVDIDAGDELVKRIQKLNPSIGGFSGLVPFGDSYLVAGTDGVGTKLKLAFDMNKHDTVGIDLVAMSVNDIVTSGAQPLFFLDYYATGFLDVDTAEQVIKGIVEGCRQAGCSLLGGETAEMPGFYQKGEYDLAGFATGAVKKDKLIDGSSIKAGDIVLGMHSTGVHSNGFSLVRKVLEVSNTSLHDKAPWSDQSFGLSFLQPTAIYVKRVLALHEQIGLKGVVHITGGGMSENIPRVIPKGLGVQINTNAWQIPPMFQWLQEKGNISDVEMRRTFNMGVGLVCVVSKEQVDSALKVDPELFTLGEVVSGNGVSYV